jgi:hypothetical protein
MDTMNRTQSSDYTDVLADHPSTDELVEAGPVIRATIPEHYTEQKGVQQILYATSQYYAALEGDSSGLAEQAELTRIAGSMEVVTSTLASHANQGIKLGGMEGYVRNQLWCTKTPESVVGKVCANIQKGKVAPLHDLHRGMFIIDGISPEAFAQSLAEKLSDPDNPAGTVAFVGGFESPHSDELIRERSRKVIVGFRHADGEDYTGEIQIHDAEGYERYRQSREQYERLRNPERAEATKKLLGSLALRAGMTTS